MLTIYFPKKQILNKKKILDNTSLQIEAFGMPRRSHQASPSELSLLITENKKIIFFMEGFFLYKCLNFFVGFGHIYLFL